MKSVRAGPTGIFFVYRVLLFFLALLALVLIAGTIYGSFLHGGSKTNTGTTVSQGERDGQDGQAQSFAGIGRLRISTAGPRPGTVILFVTFPYYPTDKAFSEELALRVRDFRAIITKYIGSFSPSELQKKSEESIKADLLGRFNAVLRLGKIGALFFSDFMILE